MGVEWCILYLGEINDSQKGFWLRCIDLFDVTKRCQTKLALFPSDRALPECASEQEVQACLQELTLHRPWQRRACSTFFRAWEELCLGQFWRECPKDNREGTYWYYTTPSL